MAETVATVPPFTLVGLTFAPDGRMFVWQKNGVVRIIKNGALLPTPFIDVSSHVNTFDDRGFWGLALDPDYATNGYVYLSYTYEEAGDPNDQGPKTARLTRVTSDPTNRDVALPGETVIMGSVGNPPCSARPAGADCLAADGGSHSLGELLFLQDGTMLVGMGDGADAGPTDPLPLRAQDLNSTNGKILRINKDGTAPPDNPYYDGTNSVRSKVWLYGVRNPFRFDVQPGTGDIWFGDVGWNTWEEVNHGTRGSNHGWPCWEGNEINDTYRTTATCAALQQSAVTMPYETYNHSTGATAVIGGPFYNATAYPQQYRGNYFYADYTGNFIKRVVFDAAHNPVGIQTFATNVQAPVSLAVGPDGFIYYLSFTTGQIRRIRPSGPAAAATATPRYGMSPLTVSFSSAGTTNPAGGSLTYNWTFGDGTTSTQANPTHTYTVSGVQTFTATLRVTDSAGVSSTATVDVTVNSTPPVPTISRPLDGTQVEPGQTVTYQGSASDPEDGPLPASALSWTILLHHNTHVHTFVGGSGSSGSFVAENHGSICTYSYEVILTATDSSGLSTSRSVNLPVIGDTTPPSAPSALTATANGAGRIDLAWQAATDDNSIGGYQVERCQGASCTNFVQVSPAPTGTSMSDVGLLPSTTYRYRVRAADAMGNVGDYSNIASATTIDAPTPPAGLVAGYTFDAGSGSTLVDVSGNGNNGTITGGTSWTTGKYGGALSFNGSTGRVSVPASASLGFSSAMTLMAWIEPTANQSGWRTIMQRESEAYFLNASNDSGPLRPSGGGTIGGDTTWVTGPTASPVNAWTHVALTYDGSTMRLYVNGTQVATAAASGAIQSSTNPLWIGGNNPYGEYFQGLIDEARVYNRALSVSEVQSAMSTALVAPTPDTTAPSTPTGLAATATSPTQVSLTWTASTDDVGVTGYRVERCAGTGCTGFTQVGTATAPTFADGGLTPNTAYVYRVRAVDAAGNASGYSTTATATTPQALDTTPPSAPTGLTATAAGTTQINLAWTAATDNIGVTQYRVERCSGTSCTNFAQVGTTASLTFSSTGLTANTTYRFRVRAADAAGNLGAYSAIASARTAANDTTRPSTPTGLVAAVAGPTRVNLTWTASTDNVGVTGYRVERCQGSGCTTFGEIGRPTTSAYSDTTVLPSTTYRYRVRAADAAGNLSTYSSIVTATTPAVPDATAPSAPGGLTVTPGAGGQLGVAWTASTDNVAVTSYVVERCQGSGCATFAPVATPTATSYNDSGLLPSTSYSYRVKALDAAGNASPYSAVASATTAAASPIPAGLVAGYTFDAGSGSTLMDVSGNGNNGTITGGTSWTTGKYGGALSFNGSTGRVSVPASPSLGLSSAMTLMAWIEPTANQSGWRTIMQRESDAYFLNASNDSGPLRPSGGATVGGDTTWVSGPTASPVNAWTHVALTYDGSTMRLYVNGTQVATAAASGAIQSSSSPLWIGGNNPYGEYFQGLIDEARVYNRALTATDIQAAMNAPLN